MLENLINFFKKMGKKEGEELLPSSSDAAKERLHLVLMQDRVNVSVDFLDMMRDEILDVVRKYIDIDEKEMDVKLTNQVNEDGTNGVPALYANIPIIGIKAEKSVQLNETNNNVNNSNEKTKISNKKDTENTQKKELITSSSKAKEEVLNNDNAKTKVKKNEVVDENASLKNGEASSKNEKVSSKNEGSSEKEKGKKSTGTAVKKKATTKKDSVS